MKTKKIIKFIIVFIKAKKLYRKLKKNLRFLNSDTIALTSILRKKITLST